MAKGKSFAVGGLLREKKTDAEIGESMPQEEERLAVPVLSATAAYETTKATDVLTLPPTGELPQPATAAPGATSISQAERRRPGPKGRGLYKKRTIDLPLDLDEFVEHARRSHVRPSGRPSTVYTHFIEDLIAEERNRRANR